MRCPWREADRDLRVGSMQGEWDGKGAQHAAKRLREALLTRPDDGTDTLTRLWDRDRTDASDSATGTELARRTARLELDGDRTANP
jgi:hypothetical protein